jgi:hypothetical protein
VAGTAGLAATGAAASPATESSLARPPARIFSETQLDALATPLSIHLERAALARSTEGMAWIVDQMNLEHIVIYDSYVQWVGVLQTFIVQQAGEDQHDAAVRQMAEHSFRDWVLAYDGKTPRERALMLARRLRASGSNFTVQEDDDRIRFQVDPWGGAARLWRAPESWQVKAGPNRRRTDGGYRYANHGFYGDPVRLAMLREARPLTQSRAPLPCFFATEIYFLEILPIELSGQPIAVVTLPETPEAAAYLDVYKDPAQIPREAYQRVGLAKPASGLPATRDRAFSARELDDLGVPLTIQVERAAASSDWARLLEISAGMDEELVGAKDPLGILINGLLTWIARNLGEGSAEKALQRTADVVMAPYIDAVRQLDAKTAIQMWAMVWRAHGSTFNIEEYPETFVFRGRPLGACARMWASPYQKRIERISDSRVRYTTFGSYDSPMCCHTMREPRGITHGKVGYPIYSTHCHMLHEIYPIDKLGYPLWVETHPLHDRDGETVHLHYKDPAAWPEKYYELVGRRKLPPTGRQA